MDQRIPKQVVIENVIQSKMRGKVIYQSNVQATIIMTTFRIYWALVSFFLTYRHKV